MNYRQAAAGVFVFFVLCFLKEGYHGGLAQLARALDLHSRGQGFDSLILHDRVCFDGIFAWGHGPCMEGGQQVVDTRSYHIIGIGYRPGGFYGLVRVRTYPRLTVVTVLYFDL